MAWTSPRTWVSGESLTAALLNTHVRDNENETAPAKVTTKGDIVAATAANTIARVAIGSDGAILVADSAATPGLRWSGTGKTAAAGVARGVYMSTPLTAAANSDVLIGVTVVPTFAKGALTGLTAYGLFVNGSSMSATGAGTIDNAYGLILDAPTIGTANWALYGIDGDYRLGGTSSRVFIGDTANTNQTVGITILGGAADEQISLKMSGLAHGMTTLVETDTYASLGMSNSARGGLFVNAIEKHTSAWPAFFLRAVQNISDTTKSTLGTGAMQFNGALTNGTGVTSLGANANIATFQDNGTTRFILDADGDSHQDVGTAWTNFDDHADAELLTALSVNVSRPDDPIRENFRGFLGQHRETLERARLVTFNDDGHHFVNMSKLAMLLTGAVRQLSAQIQAQAKELGTLRATVNLLAAGDNR